MASRKHRDAKLTKTMILLLVFENIAIGRKCWLPRVGCWGRGDCVRLTLMDLYLHGVVEYQLASIGIHTR